MKKESACRMEELEEMLIENLGENQLLCEMMNALTTDQKIEIYEYIARMNDLTEEEEEDEE